MNQANGFICLYRQITQWEWYQNPNTFRLFVHLLLMANFTDGRFEGITVKRGQLVTSLPKLSQQTKLSIQNVRTAISNLKSTGEITDEATRKYRLITIVKYDYYQQTNRQTNRQSTDNQQTGNRQGAENQQQYNNNNKYNNMEEDNTNNILTLSAADINRSIMEDQEIEDAAMSVGLTTSEYSMIKARDLSEKYGLDNLIEAIKAAVDVPKWSYVEGILRNGEIDKESELTSDRAAAERSKMKTIEIMKRLGKWDDSYNCSAEVADMYRSKGITPDEVRAKGHKALQERLVSG